jgi:hypothetical protein
VQPNKLEASTGEFVSKKSMAKAKDFTIKTKTRKSTHNPKHTRREAAIEKKYKNTKRPSTKEAIDRNKNMTQISEIKSDSLNQFNTAYPIRTPVQSSNKRAEAGVEAESELVNGLSKTNESFKKAQWLSGNFKYI